MNILGVDYGAKRIGLAWADTAVGVVLPFGVLHATRPPSLRSGEAGVACYMLLELSELIEKEKIDKVVVGLPLGLDGKENANTARVRKFVAGLKQAVKPPVEFYDERFSSAAADRMDLPRPRGRGEGVSRDEKAAMVILQSYLEQKKH